MAKKDRRDDGVRTTEGQEIEQQEAEAVDGVQAEIDEMALATADTLANAATLEPVEGAEPENVTAENSRIVKLAGEPTMWLVHDGIRYPITSSRKAVELGLPVEVVDEDTLLEWTEGEPI
jgi:hypothetical protein